MTRPEEEQNYGYRILPEAIKRQMTEEEWLWSPDKENLVTRETEPECA